MWEGGSSCLLLVSCCVHFVMGVEGCGIVVARGMRSRGIIVLEGEYDFLSVGGRPVQSALFSPPQGLSYGFFLSGSCPFSALG